MGTWSITPNNGLASIDANSGVATFKEHTSDVTYTIHFSDSTCTGGEVTKTFMVFACSQPTCVCSTFSATTSGTKVPSTTSSTEYIVGRYTAATNCSDSISITPRTGTDFLTGLRASGGNIYAKVATANTGSERSSTYFVRQGGCEDYFTAYQSSGGTPPTPTTCTCTATPVTTKLPNTITSNVTVGSYERSGDCSGAYNVQFTGSGTDFLGNFNFSSNVIKANVISANTTTSTRTGTYRIYRGSTLCSSNFTVTQAAGSPTPTCTCNDLKVSGDKTIGSSARSNFEIGTYTAGCVTNIAASEPASWITSISASNGSIKASVNENTSTTNTRATEITVTGKAGSDTCTKSFTLTQNPKSETCTTCNDANIQGLSGGATAEGGTNVLIGSFSYSCDPGLTAKRVSGGDFITNMTVSNGNVYGTVSPNTTTSERTEVIGIYVGTSKCAQYTLAQPAQICTPQLTVSATSTCCVNFKVVQPCSDIQLYDVIEWGYSKTNTPIFTNGQAFSSASAVGATGINQCPGDVSSPYNYYIFWRNKTAHSVSGSQYVTLAGCAPATCTCQEANVQVGTTAITLGNAAYSTANTTYSHDCTVYINNNEARGWLDVNATGGKLEFNSISVATSERSANVYIDDIDGRHCETIKVTQEGPTHTYSFKFKYYDYEEGPMVTGDYNRYTGYDMTDFEIDGQPATMQVEVYYRRSYYDKSNRDCMPTHAQNYTGGTSANSVQSFDEGTEWCGGSLIHVTGFNVYYNGVLIKQMQGHDSELDGTYEGELP